MKHIFAIWMQPIIGRWNSGDQRQVLIFGAIFPIVALITGLLGDFVFEKSFTWLTYVKVTYIGVFASFFILACIWYLSFLRDVVMMESPANAQLVPTLKKQLRMALLLAILGLPTLLCLAIFSYLAEKIVVTWLLGVILMAMIAGGLRSVWPLFLFSVIVIGKGGIRQAPIAEFAQQYAFFVVLATVLFVCFFVRWIFNAPIEGLFKRRDQVLKLQLAVVGEKNWELNRWRFLDSYFHWKFKRILCSKGQVDDKLNLAFGANVCAGNLALQLVLFCIVAGLGVGLVVLLGKRRDDFILLVPLLIPIPILLSIVLCTPMIFFMTLYQTRVEQALVSLVPIGRGNALGWNVVNSYLLKQFFGLWVLCLVVTSLLCSLLTLDPLLNDVLFMANFCVLPMSLSLLGDHGQRRSLQDMKLGYYVLSCVLIFVFCSLLRLGLLVPVTLLCSIVFLLSLGLLWKKWLKFCTVKQAFPVGRSVT